MEKYWRRIAPAVFTCCLMISAAASTLFGENVFDGISDLSEAEAAEIQLQNPRIEKDSSMIAGQKVTWSCVWFGSYPQTEVVSEKDTKQIAALEKMNTYYVTDYEVVSAEKFAKIETAEYEKINTEGTGTIEEATVGSEKYRRIKEGDALYATEYSEEDWGTWGCYPWVNDTSYHYFKYEPIKWRVLDVDNGQALLLADVVLDEKQYYNTETTAMTWEKCALRSFLNNYGSGANTDGTDYSSKGFLSEAFDTEEKQAIATTTLINDDNSMYGTDGGNDTTDSVFLLSGSDTWATNRATGYGFVKEDQIYDEARLCKSSTYAYAMGAGREFSLDKTNLLRGGSDWWLRTPAKDSSEVQYVDTGGWVLANAAHGAGERAGVRPALYLNLSYTGQYSCAGIVCSDGIVDKNGILPTDKKSNDVNEDQTSTKKITVKSVTLSGISKKIAAGGKIKLTAKITPSGASNKSLTWKSSNTKVATVSQSGVVKIKKGTGGKTVTITATAKDGSGKKASWKIKVAKGIVKKIKIKGAKSVKAGKNLKLKAKVTATKGANKKLRWTSSNTKYASVSQSGKVKTKKAGKGKKVKITAQATDGSGKKKSVTIKIK